MRSDQAGLLRRAGRLEKLMDFIPAVDGAAIGERAG